MLTSKHKGNVALAEALSYFAGTGYYIFLPLGDNGGSIDLAVSIDGSQLLRVQCKYTSIRHDSIVKRYPDTKVCRLSLTQTGRQRVDGKYTTSKVYEETSFDLLFVVTPYFKYLIDWKAICIESGKAPTQLILGQKMEKYKI